MDKVIRNVWNEAHMHTSHGALPSSAAPSHDDVILKAVREVGRFFNNSDIGGAHGVLTEQTPMTKELLRRSFAAQVAEFVAYKIHGCNHVLKPHRGAVLDAFQRLLPPDYGDCERLLILSLLAPAFLRLDISSFRHLGPVYSQKLNPTWDDEQLFQEARRIVIAQIQFVTLSEYLPLLLGEETMVASEFHFDFLTHSIIFALGRKICDISWTLGKLRPFGRCQYLLSGAVVRPQLKEFGGGVFNDVPQHGAESAALLIHRSRDHGIPGYVKFREYCTGEKITSFADLKDIVVEPHHLIPILSDLYRSVENVDLLVLALAEKPLRGSLVGPTLGCILASQYRKVIRGDNYWFSNINTVSSFSIAQLKAITSGTKMADIICGSADTADAAVQPNPFLLADEFDNFPISCKSEALSGMSFEEWKQLPTELPRVTPHVAKLLRDAERIVEEKNRQHTKSTDRTDEEDKFPMFPHSLFVHSPTKARDKTTELSEASGIILEATKLLAAERRSHIPSYDKSNKVAVSQFDLDCIQSMMHTTLTGYTLAGATTSVVPRKETLSNLFCIFYLLSTMMYSHMIMQFGQFLGHDITHAPLSTGPNGEALNCSSCDSFRTVSENCLPIPVPEDDPFFSPTVDGEPRCISFIRSVNGQRQLGPRSPMNKEARRIVGATIAHITFNEFLPKLLGNKVVDKYDLRPKSNAYFKGYDEDCDAGLSHSFSAAAYRVGHSMSRRFFSRPDPHFHNSTPPLDLAMNFEYADAVYDEENGVDCRKLCGLSTPVSFVDLSGDMPPSAVEALSSVYESVEDIDLFSGVVSEIPLKGAMVGPTAACIIAEQFSRLKRCDRFYYENDGPQQFTQDQLDEIRQVTLSSVICSNHGSWIRKVQPDAFAIPDDITNAPTDCDNYHMLDLTKWVDQC
ncbi:animal hem peroxidase [Ancylostoma ceylanicum]|uniref:Animal hem peroxidase n=1 Tax=Ancylostoma ceylanicum TaxID=53326 RepID=A0A0D6M6H3_9BILA|nr:animal hem peroxidase [Ancylostoma ceylanicum]